MHQENMKKGIYAPGYYEEFKCIADRCQHSCCMDWEICIDSETHLKYKKLEDIIRTVKEGEDGPCFALREDGRCPHLDDRGLCRIILSHGEDCLSEICRNHPRFYHTVSTERQEVGLGIVCEEACRLILEYEKPFSLVFWGELEGEEIDKDSKRGFDVLSPRAHMLAVIGGRRSFDETLALLSAEYEIPELYTGDEWLDRFLALDMLEEAWERDLRAMRGRLFQSKAEITDRYEKYYGRLLSYFIYRHVSVAENERELRARLAFSILSVKVIRSLFEEASSHSLEALMDLARRYSAEIEYSEDNTAELIFAFESRLYA